MTQIPGRNIFRNILLLFALISLTACGTAPEYSDSIAIDTTIPEVNAKSIQSNTLLIKQQYQTAVDFYQQALAQSTSEEQTQYIQLRLAASFAHIDQLHQSRQILAAIDAASLTAAQQQLLLLAKANIAIAERKADEVLQLLNTSFVVNTDASLLAEYHLLRALALSMLGNPLDSAQERVYFENYIQDPGLIHANQKKIWELLANLSIRSLQQLMTAPPPDILSGWMELVKIAKAYQLNPIDLKIQISKWQLNYPDHPIQQAMLENLMLRKQEDVAVPDHIALLLPLSGNFSKASDAIRDGFIAAYYSQTTERKQSIKVYDTADTTKSFADIYQQAVNDGAQFIIGPLRKQSIQQLLEYDILPVPTMALNYIGLDAPPPSNLYMFGLSPEEEARQVAQRTWLDGYIHAAAIYPSGPWGERVFNAFKTQWEAIGGLVVGQQTYNPTKRDFSRPIRNLLEINASQQRFRKLTTVLQRKIKFTARRRQDVDFIFLAAYPRQARQIRPQIKFYHAADIPVYSTSHVFTGNLNQERDRDMDGMIFGDMPWVLTESTSHHGLRADIESLISDAGNRLQRLYALGIDAFNIIPAINTLSNYSYERFDGETGSLSLDEYRRIKRQLTWVTFRSGRPSLISNN